MTTIHELRTRVIQEVGCTTQVSSGRQFDYMADRIGGCDECIGCDYGHGRDTEFAGVAGEGMEIVMKGRKVMLAWTCPSCGHKTYEDVTPISAIDKAAEIAQDPLCYSCRKKGNSEVV